MSTPRFSLSIAQRLAAIEESDWAPETGPWYPRASSRVWWRFKNGEWTIHDHSERDRTQAADLSISNRRRRR